jgi:hypothetical protein
MMLVYLILVIGVAFLISYVIVKNAKKHNAKWDDEKPTTFTASSSEPSVRTNVKETPRTTNSSYASSFPSWQTREDLTEVITEMTANPAFSSDDETKKPACHTDWGTSHDSRHECGSSHSHDSSSSSHDSGSSYDSGSSCSDSGGCDSGGSCGGD